MVYTALSQNLWLQSPYIVIKCSEDPAALVPAVRAIVASLDPRVPLRDVATMTDRLHRSTAVPRFRGLLFSALGTLALLLAVTGIYGVMAYHVSQRRRETAIRRALGARGDQIVRTTLVAGLRLAFAGIVLGTVGAVAVTRSLSALLYQVDPRDPGDSGRRRRSPRDDGSHRVRLASRARRSSRPEHPAQRGVTPRDAVVWKLASNNWRREEGQLSCQFHIIHAASQPSAGWLRQPRGRMQPPISTVRWWPRD